MNYRSIFHPDLFKDQVMVVTGGGSGIGRCTAHELAALGARVVILGRKPEKLEKVVTEITHDGGLVDSFACDIRDEEQVRNTVAAIIERHGPIKGLVNNAGGQFPSPLEAISTKGFEAVVRNNLTGTFNVAREVFNQSMSAHGGAIVNMAADMWGGMPGMGHSGAARAGVVNLTQTMAVEWAKAGVRVNCVAPGWIISSGMDQYEGAFRAIIPAMKQHVPLKRMGTESEVSAAICFLLSEGAGFISGVTIRIDGAASQGTRIFPLVDHDNSEAFNGFHRAVLPDVLAEGGEQ